MGTVITDSTLIVEEMSNFDSDDDRLRVLQPYHIEYADSDRSRSRSRNPSELDGTMVNGLRELNCSTGSEASEIDEEEWNKHISRYREKKRRQRFLSGSIGKRTISESIGSDSDREDLRVMFLDANEVGSSARRLRRKVGDRKSLQFQDPPPDRIDELEEPNTTEDDCVEDEDALRELPYYNFVSMEIDSP